MMETRNSVGLILSLTIGLLVTASVLVPSITDVQQFASAASVENEASNYMMFTEGDVVLTLADGVLTINGATVTPSGSCIIFTTDYFYLDYNGSSYYGSYLSQASGVRTIVGVDLEVADNLLTASVTYDNSTTQTVTDQAVNFSLYKDTDGEWAQFVPSSNSPYVSSVDDVIACGMYYTGELDTYYWVVDGTAGGLVDYTYDFDSTLTLADGYTDIYTISDIEVTVSNGDSTETFTPYKMFVKRVIDGHSTSGVEYLTFGLIPVVVILAIVMVAARGITRYD